MKHIARNWQGLLQGLVTWISHGYYFVNKTRYAADKDHDATDQKLIQKFYADLEKSKRWRVRKETGGAMYSLIRLHDTAFILHTDGIPLPVTDKFIDLRVQPFRVGVSGNLAFEIAVKNERPRSVFPRKA